jgi:hypothetical protein
MDLRDLRKLYEGSENPMEQLIELRDTVDGVIQRTLQWYLERDSFQARRLAKEVRNIREVLLEFQLVLEGISLAEDGSPQEVDLRES